VWAVHQEERAIGRRGHPLHRAKVAASMDRDLSIGGSFLNNRRLASIGPIHIAGSIAHEAVVPKESFARSYHVRKYPVTAKPPHPVSPSATFAPQMLAVQIVVRVQAKFERMNIPDRDLFSAPARQLPNMHHLVAAHILA